MGTLVDICRSHSASISIGAHLQLRTHSCARHQPASEVSAVGPQKAADMQRGQLHVCTGIRVLVRMDRKEGTTAAHELDAL